MKKLILLILVLGLLALAGCQDQPSGSQTAPAESTASAGPATSGPEQAEPQAQPVQAEPTPSAGSEPAEALQTGLAHHNFIFKTFDGRELPATNPDGSHREPPHLSFSQWPHANGRICNTFRGQVELDGGSLTMKNAASTMMLCIDPLINELETAFHQMLNEGVKVELAERTLTLSGGGHSLVLELSDYVN